jgi:hypothetical protein
MVRILILIGLVSLAEIARVPSRGNRTTWQNGEIMRHFRVVAPWAIAIGSILLSFPALAACTVPNALSNGQVADASEVMDNFNAVATCADDAVTPSGTPSTGQIATFSGSKTITGGNLSGDVTTSGSAATTLSSTGVTPGTYANATIAVDSKGRITSATNGGAGSVFGLVHIADQVADGTSGAVAFSSIPQTYRDLLVIITGQSVNTAQELIAYANSDTANSNYRNFTWNQFGTGSISAPRVGVFPGLGVPSSGTAALIKVEFFSYSSNVWKKSAMSESQYEDSSNFFRNIMDWKWNNTSPITQLTFQIGSGNIANGTVFSLYGRGVN